MHAARAEGRRQDPPGLLVGDDLRLLGLYWDGVALLLAAVAAPLVFLSAPPDTGGVQDHDLELDVAPRQGLLAEQAKATRAHQRRFDGVDGAADGRLVDAIRLGDVGLGAVFAPIYQRQQVPVLAAEFGSAPARRHVLLQSVAHVQEGRQARRSVALGPPVGLGLRHVAAGEQLGEN